MSDWIEKLKQAKSMLEMGLISQEQFEAIQAQALQAMGMSTEGGSSNSDELFGAHNNGRFRYS